MKQCGRCKDKDISRDNEVIGISPSNSKYHFTIHISYCTRCGKVDDGDTWVDDGVYAKKI